MSGMSDRDDKQANAEEDAQDDLELREGEGGEVIGGAKPGPADGSRDAGVHFKYDLKAQKGE
jgi:hypothetical protein